MGMRRPSRTRSGVMLNITTRDTHGAHSGSSTISSVMGSRGMRADFSCTW
jgi:hypothetical protein